VLALEPFRVLKQSQGAEPGSIITLSNYQIVPPFHAIISPFRDIFRRFDAGGAPKYSIFHHI
jgi:hypothetical protein